MENVLNNEEQIKKELANVLSIKDESPPTIEKNIIFDGKQFSVRIPRKFADAMKLNPKEDSVRFILTISADKKSYKLTAEVEKRLEVQKNEEEII